jgi:hypothetical protein
MQPRNRNRREKPRHSRDLRGGSGNGDFLRGWVAETEGVYVKFSSFNYFNGLIHIGDRILTVFLTKILTMILTSQISTD